MALVVAVWLAGKAVGLGAAGGTEPGLGRWDRLPSLPDEEGWAGVFAGSSGKSLLVAGGANFPAGKPWAGGTKVWHDGVFVLSRPDGRWRRVGRLPRRLAYGVSVSTPAGVVCVGGSDADRHYAETFRMDWGRHGLRIEPLPNLPWRLAQAAGAVVEGTLYVCGGSDEPGEKAGLNRLFSLALERPGATWREEVPCPGEGRILPVAAGLAPGFYWAGGAAVRHEDGAPRRVYLRDVWCFEPGGGWRRVADLPHAAVGAPSPAPVGRGRWWVLGGDDGSRVGFAPVERHPGFPGTIQGYDVGSGRWWLGGGVAAPRVTLPAVWWRGGWVLPSGEVRPGVRSPEVWTLRGEP